MGDQREEGGLQVPKKTGDLTPSTAIEGEALKASMRERKPTRCALFCTRSRVSVNGISQYPPPYKVWVVKLNSIPEQITTRYPVVGQGIEDAAVATVDSFQGLGNEVVLLDFILTGGNDRESGFIADKHRLNIALIRARDVLIVIGSKSTRKRSSGQVSTARDAAYLLDIVEDLPTYEPIPIMPSFPSIRAVCYTAPPPSDQPMLGLAQIASDSRSFTGTQLKSSYLWTTGDEGNFREITLDIFQGWPIQAEHAHLPHNGFLWSATGTWQSASGSSASEGSATTPTTPQLTSTAF